MEDILFKYNDVTTSITQDVKDKLSRDSFAELFDYIDSIELLKYMTSGDRPAAKDKPINSKGHIDVDITKPHILEDMDYFRPAAIHFEKHGVYTKLYPNRNPNSAYRKFWDEEIRRSIEGYIRESDGEWISGYNYFYWNYSPIMKTIQIGDANEDGAVRSDRVYKFANVWDGDYLYFHYVEQAEELGRFGAVLKARGKGYSFKAGAMLLRNMLLISKSKSYALADDAQFLLEDGVLTKAWDVLDWCNTNTAFSKLLSKTTEMHKRSGYLDKDTNTEKGFGSEVIGVTLKNNPNKARGKRGKLFLWEEAGSFPDILTSWKIAQKSLEDGNNVFGFMIAFGTGGDSTSKGFFGLNTLFYEGGAYRVLKVRNVWDKNASANDSAFFVPDYMNRANCYDKDGNSDVIKALLEVIYTHDVIRKESSDPNALAQEKAETPTTPSEATMIKMGSVFPVLDLKDHLASIAPSIVKFISEHYVGRLNPSGSGEVSWIPDADVHIIRDFPHGNIANLDGGIELFMQPIKGNDGKAMRGRYILGVDPVDYDSGTSLASTFVFDLFTDKIVAEYTGRPQTANEYYENVLRLAKYYNGSVLYENNLKGLFAYFSNRHVLHYLADVPQILKDMQYIKGKTIGNKAKGCPANQYINGWARKLLSDWMLSRSSDDPEDFTVNLQTIRSVALLKESIMWNGDINTDRVSAMGMVMILREDKLSRLTALKDATDVSEGLSDDSFFNRNYTSIDGLLGDGAITEIN